MFKKFTEEDVSSKNTPKSSVTRGIKKEIMENYSHCEKLKETISSFENVQLYKCKDRITLLCNDNSISFFQLDETEFLPHLMMLNTHRDMLPKVQVDRGAIKFVIQGADIMAPGLLTSGGHLPSQLGKNRFVGVYCEGKDHPIAIGRLLEDSDKIINSKAGKAIEVIHSLNDGVWRYQFAIQN